MIAIVFARRSSASIASGPGFLNIRIVYGMASHRVRFEPQGRMVQVAAETAILDAALAAGLNLPHSCKSGHCGSCRARLVSGPSIIRRVVRRG